MKAGRVKFQLELNNGDKLLLTSTSERFAGVIEPAEGDCIAFTFSKFDQIPGLIDGAPIDQLEIEVEVGSEIWRYKVVEGRLKLVNQELGVMGAVYV